MRRKKLTKRLLWVLLFAFIAMNVVAGFHAYKFTHFATSGPKTKDASFLSPAQKLGVAIFGISNPRPQNKAMPDTAYETVRLKSNREIECWSIRVKNSKGTVVLFHGYSGNKSTMLDKATVFRNLGYSTLLVDFMGSGGSEGSETTIGFKEAEQVKSCYDYLKADGEDSIILFGTSMGAAAVMKAINDYQLAATSIIVECPFSTMLQTVKARFDEMGLPTFPMAHLLVFWGGIENGFNAYSHNPIDYAKNIHCPTLLLSGEKDQKVSVAETKAILANLAGPKKLATFPDAVHENYLKKYRNEWTSAVADFLASDKVTQ